MNKKILSCLLVFLTLFLCSCHLKNTDDSMAVNGRQVSVKIQKNECVFNKIAPSKTSKQLIEFSGNSSKSEKLKIDSQTMLRVYWNQFSTKDYELSISKIGSDEANDPMNLIILESMIGPSSGCTDVILEAGDYKVNVENANNDWKVIIDALSQ